MTAHIRAHARASAGMRGRAGALLRRVKSGWPSLREYGRASRKKSKPRDRLFHIRLQGRTAKEEDKEWGAGGADSPATSYRPRSGPRGAGPGLGKGIRRSRGVFSNQPNAQGSGFPWPNLDRDGAARQTRPSCLIWAWVDCDRTGRPCGGTRPGCRIRSRIEPPGACAHRLAPSWLLEDTGRR